MSLEELVVERSKKCEVFSNPLRSFITVFIAAKGEVAWSELKSALKRWAGPVNPNTLNFHIGKLIDAGFVDKVDIEGQPRYRIIEGSLREIERIVGKDLVKKCKRSL